MYAASSIDFSGIVVTGTPNCNGLKYKVAVQTAGATVRGPSITVGTPTISAATLSVAIPAGTVASNVTGVSLTIYS